jgi:Xaa-Pro aminopeptidase
MGKSRKNSVKLLHEVRAPKSHRELRSIIQAQRISEKVLRDVLGFLRTGKTEIEVQNFIKKCFVKYGTPVLAFTPIVAFGKGSADIHHEPAKIKLKEGDIIMLDFGTTVNHYCSDMTRTFFWGAPTPKQARLYLDVLRAMEIAIGKLKHGEKRAKAVDSSARKFLAKKYKNNFKHGLGHGVGTVIHEWPNFKPNSLDILPVGTVMTVEPGIYLKNFGGVRIEDMVLVTKSGVRNLTNPPKDLASAILKPR